MFTSSKEKIGSTLALLNSVVTAKPLVPAYAFILMEGSDGDLWMTASDGEVTVVTSIEVGIEQEFAWGIPAKHFAELVALFGSEFSVEDFNDGRILVKHGKARHRLLKLPRDKFPESQPVRGPSVALSGNLLRTLIEATAFAVDPKPDGKFPAMRGVQVMVKDGSFHMVGCDGVRMAVASIPMGGDFEVVIPSKAIGVFSKFADGPAEVELVPQENQVSLRGERGNIISRRLVGQFPNWQLAMPKDLPFEAQMSATTLTLAIRRAGLAANPHDSAESPAFACKFTLSESELYIETQSEAHGEGEEHVDISCPGLKGQEPMVIGVAGKQVLDFLKIVTQGDLIMKFKDPDSPLVFAPHGALGYDYKYFTMPCRLKF